MPSDPDPPRVLRLITRLNIGGPARQALLLSRELAPEFPTTLAAGTPTAEEGELSDPVVPVTRVPLVRPLHLTKDPAALYAVRRLMARERPAILHTHMAKAGAIGRLAALSIHPRPRTVHTFHGHVLSGYFSEAAGRAFRETERLLARRTDLLIAVSTEVRDSLLGAGIGRPEQYCVVPLGLDLDAFTAIQPVETANTAPFRAALRIPPDRPLIGIVGRLVPIKNVAMALECVTLLDGVHLAVIGDGELRASLEKQARTLGVADRVHFTGWCEDIPGALAALDAVILTSRNEGTPVALIEAQAAGRPVVATDVGGVRSVVGDRETGYLVRPGDGGGMAGAVKKLLGNPGLRTQIGTEGRKRAVDSFGKQALLSEIAALYRELLGQAPRQ